MNVIQTRSFTRSVKRLKNNQKEYLDKAVRRIINNPEIGVLKSGNLSNVRVHKFKMVKQLVLLAYTWKEETITLTLLAVGTHENFYRDLGR